MKRISLIIMVLGTALALAPAAGATSLGSGTAVPDVGPGAIIDVWPSWPVPWKVTDVWLDAWSSPSSTLATPLVLPLGGYAPMEDSTRD